jgi:hypothetical protein
MSETNSNRSVRERLVALRLRADRQTVESVAQILRQVAEISDPLDKIDVGETVPAMIASTAHGLRDSS